MIIPPRMISLLENWSKLRRKITDIKECDIVHETTHSCNISLQHIIERCRYPQQDSTHSSIIQRICFYVHHYNNTYNLRSKDYLFQSA